MGTFAETANLITVYRLPIQTTVFRFPFGENKRKFAVSFFCLQQTNVPD
jgi:hypothetical protein